MLMKAQRSVLALAAAALAVACADSTAPARTLLENGIARNIIDSVQTYPFPTIGAGVVELCKYSNVPGTFDFTVSVNGGQPQNVSIAVPGNPCTPVYTSTLSNGSGSEVVVITENALSSAWTTTTSVTRFLGPNVIYAPTSLSDLEEPLLRRVTVRANIDMARRVRFTNTFTSTPDPICDFITFGRLVTEVGALKVVVSGNAGGFNQNGTIKGEFHVEVNDVDNHVADIDTYGPITSGPLSGPSFPNSRMVTGIAKNGVAVELRLWDGGEPGKDTDWVYVKLGPAGTEPLGAAGQTIDQGNMQYHPHCRGPVPSSTSSASENGRKKG